MKKKVYRERHGYTAPIAIEKDPVAKEVKIRVVKKPKNHKKKGEK